MAIGIPEKIDGGCLRKYITSPQSKVLKKMRNKKIRIESKQIDAEHPIVKESRGWSL